MQEVSPRFEVVFHPASGETFLHVATATDADAATLAFAAAVSRLRQAGERGEVMLRRIVHGRPQKRTAVAEMILCETLS